MDITNDVINISGGRSSAYMAIRLIQENEKKYTLIYANTGKERIETINFLKGIEKIVNQKIICIEYDPDKRYIIKDLDDADMNGNPFMKLIEKYRMIPSVKKRICTGHLKIKPVKRFMNDQGFKNYNSYVGIRYDEPIRWGKMIANQHPEPFYYCLPLVEWKINKSDVMDFWKANPQYDLKMDSIYGNCDLCFLKSKNKLINIIRKNPVAVEWWIAAEKKFNGTFKDYWSFEELKKLALNQGVLEFNDDMDYPCHCNIE